MSKTRNLIATAVTPEVITTKIFVVRGKKVMLDRDLAGFYGVVTKRLNEQVKRNIRRFPFEFMFQLNRKETRELVANCDRLDTLKHSSTQPYVFTEHGVAMLSSVLNSERAIQINIMIIKAFISFSKGSPQRQDILKKIKVIEQKSLKHDRDIEIHDTDIQELFLLIDQLQAETEKINNPGKFI